MRKGIIALAVLGMACVVAAHAAGGREENESHQAESPEGFTSSIPIERKKVGKWNFYIEAKDKGGNTTIHGPHNIWNDPESDLPITTIINPRRNMHVQGNLNIVGVATDDDGVEHVEFMVHRGPDGAGTPLVHQRADGAAFWSYYLDTTDEEIWTDGVYTLTAWATDINGLSGLSEQFPPRQRKYHKVLFHLDRKKPQTIVRSHETGALVSRNITLSGSVFDGNGVDMLRYSLDDGATYRNLPLKQNRNGSAPTWELKLDTRTFEDGPKVIWFRAWDGQGTLGVAAHLLFINNTDPEVQILYPDPNRAVSGVFSVAVYANHPVGLRGVSWKLGRETGHFPMTIGNDWWVQEFDIRGQRVSTIDLEIRAEDLSGNYTIAKRKLRVDQNAGMMRVNLTSPVANAVISGDTLSIKGNIEVGPDDTAASVLYSINGGAPVETPTSGSFQISVPGLVAGTHTLEVWAKDIIGVEGPKTAVRGLVNPGAMPEPRIASVTPPSSKVPRAFYTGMQITLEPRMALEFAVKTANPITRASISFNGGASTVVTPRAGKDDVWRVDVPFPATLPAGLNKAELRATDRHGREAVYEDYFYNGAGGVPTFQWVRPVLHPENNSFLFTTREQVLIGLGGLPLYDAKISGSGADSLYVSMDSQGRVQLQARAEGNFGPVTLTLEDRNGGSFASDPFTVLVNYVDPAINLMATTTGWVQNETRVQFNIAGAGRFKSVDYSMNLGESWGPVVDNVATLTNGAVLDRTLDISGMEDGTVNILLRVVDEVGRTAVKSFFVQKDTKPPEAQLVMPFTDASVNGTIRLGISVQEAGKLKSVTYSRPALTAGGPPAITKQVYPYADADQIDNPRFLNILMDSIEMPLAEHMVFIFEDEAGNKSELGGWPFVIDNEMDIPVLHVTLPLENEVIISDFEVSGIMFDDDMIRQIYWKIDNGTETVMDTMNMNGFSIPISLSGMGIKDNEHTITVYAEDIYGVKSEPVTRGFRVSLREPVASVTTPSFDMVSGGLIEMSGGGFDENGIEKVQVSLDNGLTFNDTRINAYDNTAEWFYEFNSNILKDGPHVMFTRVFDKYGISAIYAGLVNIDNTPPVITLNAPLDGTITTSLVHILGEVTDNNLEAKVLELRSLQGVRIPEGFKRYRAGQTPFLRESFDLAALPDGSYNVEVQAEDKAGNITVISRNVELSRDKQTNFVDVLYPLNGEHVQGNFILYGSTGGADRSRTVTLKMNGVDVITNETTWTGYYSFALNEQHLIPGWNEMTVTSNFGSIEIYGENEAGEMVVVGMRAAAPSVVSDIRRIHYQPEGPWVTIESLTMGDFAFDRPWLSGRAGYTLSEEDYQLVVDRKSDPEARAEALAKTLDFIDLSFDNGNTFVRTNRTMDAMNDWRYRLETGELSEGFHYILVRARMKNGEIAVTRTTVQVDKTAPYIKLIAPEPGGRYNQDLEFAAMASDDVELASLSYHLRVGDKMFYEVPGFLQGLYFEAIIPPFIRQITNDAPPIFAGGSTYMDVGFGLSFFEDNVKIQMQYGFLTQELYEALGGEPAGPSGDKTVRYGGHVLGLKILANIYTLPFIMVLGPDWEWLYASVAVGANFSLFDLGREGYTQSGDPTWMSALLLQVEFPRVTIPKREKLRTFSFFTEGQLWFVPTDVSASAFGIKVVIPHVILGLRLYIF